jgi:hypothetical protein
MAMTLPFFARGCLTGRDYSPQQSVEPNSQQGESQVTGIETVETLKQIPLCSGKLRMRQFNKLELQAQNQVGK